MAQPRTRPQGAYPLQAPVAFEIPQYKPPNARQPTTTQSRTPQSHQSSDRTAWQSANYPLQAMPVQNTQTDRQDFSPRAQSPAQPISPPEQVAMESLKRTAPGSYPLQTMPVRSLLRPEYAAPQSVTSTPRSVYPQPQPDSPTSNSAPSGTQRQETDERNPRSIHQENFRHRTLSPSYPLQARPSQILRDLSPRAPVSPPRSTEPKLPPHTEARTTPASPRVYYGAQAIPATRSPKNVSVLSPSSTPVTFAAQSPETYAAETHPIRMPQRESIRPQQPQPLHTVLGRSFAEPAGKVVEPSQRTEKHSSHSHSLVSPAPTSELSDETAVSSGRAFQDQAKRRRPYPFQAVPQGTPKVEGSIESASEKMDSSTPSLSNESGRSLPRVPRNIRALKNGKHSELPGRTIVICLDGTGDKFDSDNSNIVHLVSCLKKSDASQITYYQSGIGTYDGGGLSNGLNAALDMAVGSGLGVHVRDAYHFLMQNYIEGDRICLFGFSRGAYTARCLAGMVHKVGLLPAHNVQQLPFAYEYYKDDTENGWEMSGDFKRTFCMDVSVHFIGVFDSVASVGFIPRTLPLSATPWNKATYFRHALALDEHRAKFKAKHFEQKDSIDSSARWETIADSHDGDGDVDPDTGRRASTKAKSSLSEVAEDGQPIEADSYLRQKRAMAQAKHTDVLEVWFAGAHADVGGGAEKNTVRHKLAQIPLRWMLRQCFECDTGIIFKVHRLAEEGLDIHTLWPTYISLGIPRMGPSPSLLEKHQDGKIAPICRRSSVLQPADKNDPQGPHDVVLWQDEEKRHLHEAWVPEHVEDYFDSISRINDQLVGATAWWILEVWPIKIRVQASDSEEWVKKVSMNLGRYRAVQDAAPNLHWTVQQRIEAMGYKLNVRMGRKSCWNIVA